MKLSFKYFKRITVFGTAIFVIGCGKLSDFGNTNIAQDASTTPSTTALISNAETTIGSILSSTIGGTRGSLYAQQFSETQYTDVSIYGNPQLEFGGTYSGALMDLEKAINYNMDPATKSSVNVIGTPTSPLGSNANQIAIAKILKSYIIWTITDRWGDVPYTDAFRGALNLTPTYDKQADIYDSLLNTLATAITTFDNGPTVKGDIFYAGSATKWKKLANTMRMLIALRMSKVYPASGGKAANAFAAAYGDLNGAITSVADNWVQPYPGGSSAQNNVWYSLLNGRRDYAFSKTFADILNNMSDPRLAAFTGSGTPFPYGLDRAKAVQFDGSVSGNWAKLFNGSYAMTATKSIVIIPASYTLLAQAEAVERNWISGNSQSLYEAGVTASFVSWGLTSSDAANYLSGAANFLNGTGGGSAIGYSSAFPSIVGSSAITATKLERIQLQRYIASFGDGIQAWAEWKRTGVPKLVPTAFGVNSPLQIPRRLTYGNNEYATNVINVKAASARYNGGDVMNARMWWDQ